MVIRLTLAKDIIIPAIISAKLFEAKHLYFSNLSLT